jgi:dTDP-4-dehydrorhamnose reductase
MDERLEQALEQANYSVTVQNQKKNFQRRFNEACVYALNGGTFVANHELIAFVHALVATGREDGIVIDQRGNPIEITDLASFADDLIETYTEAANELHFNIEGLKKARRTGKVVGL